MISEGEQQTSALATDMNWIRVNYAVYGTLLGANIKYMCIYVYILVDVEPEPLIYQKSDDNTCTLYPINWHRVRVSNQNKIMYIYNRITNDFKLRKITTMNLNIRQHLILGKNKVSRAIA